MMKILFNILCVLMAIAMTACTNEELLVVEGQTPAVPGEKVSVEAYAPGGDKAGSRIVFQENEGDKPTVSLSWSTEKSLKNAQKELQDSEKKVIRLEAGLKDK